MTGTGPFALFRLAGMTSRGLSLVLMQLWQADPWLDICKRRLGIGMGIAGGGGDDDVKDM